MICPRCGNEESGIHACQGKKPMDDNFKKEIDSLVDISYQTTVDFLQNEIKQKDERIEELEEKLSHLCKIPTKPYERELAKRIIDVEKRIEELEDALRELKRKSDTTP